MIHQKYRVLSISIALFFMAFHVSGQKRSTAKISNLGGFDTRNYHFGVQLSVNSADFYMDQKFDPMFQDSLISLQNFSQPGFNIAIIGALHFNKNWSLRIIPGISPKERKFTYNFLESDGTILPYDKVISSFYIDVPVLIKYRTDRINNFAAYVIGGGQISRDMASQEKVKNELASFEDQVIKIERLDFLLSAGGGFDFFLPYFKFGIELKMVYGLKNILIQDNTQFSSPIESLRSRNFVLSFTFEG
ncbi:MAG: PorT family protein [Flavobacteriales bacterium]|nr:PorT family protein [Flavobacteriales bacterium]